MAKVILTPVEHDTSVSTHFTYFIAEAIYNIVCELKFDCYVNGSFFSTEIVPSRIKLPEKCSEGNDGHRNSSSWKDMATRSYIF